MRTTRVTIEIPNETFSSFRKIIGEKKVDIVITNLIETKIKKFKQESFMAKARKIAKEVDKQNISITNKTLISSYKNARP